MDDSQKDFPAYPKQGSYLDSATKNLQPKSVIEAQNWYNMNLGSVTRKSLYQRARQSTEIYLETKERLVSQFGGISDNYVFFPNLDYAWNVILTSLVQHHKKNHLPQPEFITSIYEEHSILAPLVQLLQNGEISLKFIETDETEMLISSLELVLKKESYVALSQISPLSGHYRDLELISEVIRKKSAKLLTDLSRGAGQNPVRIAHLQLDLAIIDPSLDLLGPQGICFAYLGDMFFDVSSPFSGTNSIREVRIDSIDQLSSYERFEIGDLNLPSISGLKSALDYIQKLKTTSIVEHRKQIQTHLRKLISESDLIVPVGQLDQTNPSSIISFRIEGVSTHDAILLMEEAFSVEIRSGTLCSHPGLKLLKLPEVLTVSTHVYNNISEMDLLVESLEQTRVMLM